MFKLIYSPLTGPMGDINVSSSLVAEAGMIGYIANNNGVAEVRLATSGTTGTLGIIDDNKTTAFMAAVVNETVSYGQTTLAHANLVSGSFYSASGASVSSYTNGTITNTLSSGTTTTATYSYYIPGKSGDDTTLASGKCTIWLAEGEFGTDLFEISASATLSSYVPGAALYVSSTAGQVGRLTTVEGAQKVGYVSKAPTAGNPYLHFYKISNN